eukprot:GILJ01002923.1.p1 GENE.GILJ01002923.1~~GILJ01002923.1.p1  ORF type:complete len:625 (-),score=46.75 GILJ01002923.1:91-1965(-)
MQDPFHFQQLPRDDITPESRRQPSIVHRYRAVILAAMFVVVAIGIGVGVYFGVFFHSSSPSDPPGPVPTPGPSVDLPTFCAYRSRRSDIQCSVSSLTDYRVLMSSGVSRNSSFEVTIDLASNLVLDSRNDTSFLYSKEIIIDGHGHSIQGAKWYSFVNLSMRNLTLVDFAGGPTGATSFSCLRCNCSGSFSLIFSGTTAVTFVNSNFVKIVNGKTSMIDMASGSALFSDVLLSDSQFSGDYLPVVLNAHSLRELTVENVTVSSCSAEPNVNFFQSDAVASLTVRSVYFQAVRIKRHLFYFPDVGHADISSIFIQTVGLKDPGGAVAAFYLGKATDPVSLSAITSVNGPPVLILSTDFHVEIRNWTIESQVLDFARGDHVLRIAGAAAVVLSNITIQYGSIYSVMEVRGAESLAVDNLILRNISSANLIDISAAAIHLHDNVIRDNRALSSLVDLTAKTAINISSSTFTSNHVVRESTVNSNFLAPLSEQRSVLVLHADPHADSGVSAVVQGCSFTDNEGSDSGGALLVGLTTKLSDCVFKNNSADSNGGALGIMNTSPQQSLVSCVHCTFECNRLSSETGGTAIYVEGEGNVVMDIDTSSVFVDNPTCSKQVVEGPCSGQCAHV